MEQVAGLERDAYNPRLTALALWLVGSDLGQKIPADHLVEAASTRLTAQFAPGYLEKYLGKLDGNRPEPEEPLRFQRFLVDDAITETEATLRRFALDELGIDPKSPTVAFEIYPKYVSAAEGFRALELRVRSLELMRITLCPTCLLLGSVATWFGYRTIKGKVIPQSWCSVCRGLGHSDAMDDRILALFNSDSWFGLSSWEKEAEILTAWERSFAFRMGQALSQGWQLSEKQLAAAKKVAAKALANGFKP